MDHPGTYVAKVPKDIIKGSANYIHGFWSDLHRLQLADEPFVGRIHLIEMLEEVSRYNNGGHVSYFHRMQKSLAALPFKYREAALIVFSRVLYFPTAILNEAWKYLWFALRRYALGGISEREVLSDVQFFEVDPSGNINQFAHLNRLDGRLDTETHSRANDVRHLAALLLDLTNRTREVRTHAIEELKLLRRKRYWLILTDKALSGHSLGSDLKRYIQISEFFNETFRTEIKIVVLAQMITVDAVRHISELCNLARQPNVTILAAAELDASCKMNSEQCQLLVDKSQREKVRSLCEWFSRTYLAPDTDLGRMRTKSGDNLEFGYRRCGLTVCDSTNCPTDSLPVLWYDSRRGVHDKRVPIYCGPYPRVHSRIGDQSRKPLISRLETIDSWKDAVRRYVR